MASKELTRRSSVMLVVLACGSLISKGQNRADGAKDESRYPRITCEELKKLIDAKGSEDLVIVDTQASEYYAEGHIAGAVSLSYADKIRTPVNLPRNKTLVLYCPCEHEEESSEMAAKLEKLGYSKLKLLQGGLPRWQQLKYPTVPAKK